jgi:hypothetical protein
MASVGAGSAYAVSFPYSWADMLFPDCIAQTDIVAVQRVFYGQTTNFGCMFPINIFPLSSITRADQWMLVMSTQLIGFSIGGLCRRFLVSPPSMIWPSNLVSSALFNTLHQKETAGSTGRGGMSRERFFVYVFSIYFVYSKWSFVHTTVL